MSDAGTHTGTWQSRYDAIAASGQRFSQRAELDPIRVVEAVSSGKGEHETSR